MSVRMDHVVLVVDDLDAGIAFFQELGLELEGRMPVSGRWVDRVNGMDGVAVEIAMLRTPDGHNKLELTRFDSPKVQDPGPLPPSVMGLRSVMFAVDDLRDTVGRLERRGGKLIGEIAEYQDIYRLCYLRGPGGSIVALAQELKRS